MKMMSPVDWLLLSAMTGLVGSKPSRYLVRFARAVVEVAAICILGEVCQSSASPNCRAAHRGRCPALTTMLTGADVAEAPRVSVALALST